MIRFSLSFFVIATSIALNQVGYMGHFTTINLLLFWLVFMNIEYSAREAIDDNEEFSFKFDVFSALLIISSLITFLLSLLARYPVDSILYFGTNWVSDFFPTSTYYIVQFFLMSVYLGLNLTILKPSLEKKHVSINKIITTALKKTTDFFSDLTMGIREALSSLLKKEGFLVAIAWFIVLITILSEWDFYPNELQVYLATLLVAITLLPLVNSIKILDILEIKKDIKEFEKKTEERFNQINSFISSLTATFTASQSTIASLASHINTNINNKNTVNVVLQLAQNLQQAVEPLVDDVSKSDFEAQERELPRATNMYEKIVSIFRLRFLVEEKVKKIAQRRNIIYQRVLDTARIFLQTQIIDVALLRSIENIIGITDEIVQTGFEISATVADQIIENGKYVLATLDRAGERQNEKSRERVYVQPEQPFTPTNDDEDDDEKKSFDLIKP